MIEKMLNLPRNTAVLLLFSTSMIVWYMHVREIDIPKKIARQELHTQIIERTAPSPYRYRVLLPYTAEALSRVSKNFLDSDRALLLSYAIIEAAAITALILILYFYLCFFFDTLPALVGALFANLSLVVALRDHYFQPWSLANALAFALAAWLLVRRRMMAFGIVVLLSAFNRETSLLLAFIYLIVSFEKGRYKKPLLVFAGLVALWCAAYLLTRSLQGSAAHIYNLSDILSKNLSVRNIGYALVNLLLFMGFFWVFVFKGFKNAPPFIKRLSLFVPLYLLLVVLFGVWKEVRLIMPLYPVLLPLGLSFLFPLKRG